MSQAATGVFGSGWAWLVSDQDGTLIVLTTANQDVPDLKLYTSIFPIDVWEHAYYLQYQNRRPDYVEGWHKLIHWKKRDDVTNRYFADWKERLGKRKNCKMTAAQQKRTTDSVQRAEQKNRKRKMTMENRPIIKRNR